MPGSRPRSHRNALGQHGLMGGDVGGAGIEAGTLRLGFFGAAGTVTGSRYLLDLPSGARVLVDCGLFQGLKSLRLRNRAPFPVPPATIDAVVVTHAHIDHIGYLPVLVREGFAGPVYASPATADLAGIMLRDAAHLQEEEARFANRHGYSRHNPAVPLFTTADADAALARVTRAHYGEPIALAPDAEAVLIRNGHIPGSASIHLRAAGRTILFSGDVGRPDDALLRPGERSPSADYVVMESTYGGRAHPKDDPADELASIVAQTAARGGTVVVPAFAVGRAQTLLVELARLRRAARIPAIPVILDSPMAARVSAVIERHLDELRIDAAEWSAAMDQVQVATSVDDSKAIAQRAGPAIIVAGSGMATGGRVIHHLRRLLPDHRHAVVFAGFQAPGTRGQALVDGASHVRIHGSDVPVRARVYRLDGYSAHADHDQLVAWLAALERLPRRVFLTHGEPLACDQLRSALERRLGRACVVPDHLSVSDLEVPEGARPVAAVAV